MHNFIIILSCITVAAGTPTVQTWTLSELSEGIQSNKTSSELKPYLEDALNKIMLAIFTGNEKTIYAVIRSPNGGVQWTQEELRAALRDPATKSEFRGFLNSAYHFLEYNKDQKSVEVNIPALDISTWTMADLDEALGNKGTNTELITYLEKAKTELENDLLKRDKITIVTPVGLIKSGNEESIIVPRKWESIAETSTGRPQRD